MYQYFLKSILSSNIAIVTMAETVHIEKVSKANILLKGKVENLIIVVYIVFITSIWTC